MMATRWPKHVVCHRQNTLMHKTIICCVHDGIHFSPIVHCEQYTTGMSHLKIKIHYYVSSSVFDLTIIETFIIYMAGKMGDSFWLYWTLVYCMHNYKKAKMGENFFHLIPLPTLILYHRRLTFTKEGEELPIQPKYSNAQVWWPLQFLSFLDCPRHLILAWKG
jgi:hypothetical protein